MYTEDENKKSLKSVFIKIVLIVLLLFVLMMLFPTKGFITNVLSNKKGINDSYFNSNLIAMATAGSGYFNESRLPEKTGDEVKMTLKEMLDKKIIVKFTDSKGITCSTRKSYVLVKKEENEYTMKVNLSCTDKTDYIVLHMGHDGTQFPSTSTARCTFVKNLDEAWAYGEWSSWSTNKIVEDGTNQVETSVRSIQSGTKTVTRNEVETQPANTYTYSNGKTYYVCSSKYDNKGTYENPTTCVRNIVIYSEVPTYSKVTYYRSRSKELKKGEAVTKEADCNDESLIKEGYTKLD